jgi:hypothetical protein
VGGAPGSPGRQDVRTSQGLAQSGLSKIGTQDFMRLKDVSAGDIRQ